MKAFIRSQSGLELSTEILAASKAQVLAARLLSHHCASTSTAAISETRLPEGPPLSHFIRPTQGEFREVIQTKNAGKGVYIETYGCQQNISDSEIVYSILDSAGFHKADDAQTADTVLLNTCSIREKAEARIFSRLGVLRDRKGDAKDNSIPGQTIGILGCMAERLKDKMLVKEKLADLVVGPDAYRDLPRLLAAVKGKSHDKLDAINVQLSVEETYADILPSRPAGTKSTFLSIMRGCNNLCSFCIVPFTRGRERSRPVQSILEEVRRLSNQGVKELTLLGQNVNSYADFSQSDEKSPMQDADAFGFYAKGFQSVYKPKRGGACRFAELLDKVASVDPEMRIWFTSPHPKDFSDEVLEVIGRCNNIAKMIHMPAQSGSSRMLEIMRRGYSRESYDALVQHIKATIPSVALSTDMIVGFCGETEEDHQHSLHLMRSTAYDQAFLFAYSKRDKTHAARHLEDDVLPEEKKRRLQEIIDLFKGIQVEQKLREVGRRHLVLVDFLAKDGQWLGRTANMQRIKLQSSSPAACNVQLGDYIDAEVVGTSGSTLIGRVCNATSTASFVRQHGSVLPVSSAAKNLDFNLRTPQSLLKAFA